jgi:hypothetical protein
LGETRTQRLERFALCGAVAERELHETKQALAAMTQRALTAETNLHLAYQVYRDAGGKVGGNSIFSFGEWLLWLPSQTDELLDPQAAQP